MVDANLGSGTSGTTAAPSAGLAGGAAAGSGNTASTAPATSTNADWTAGLPELDRGYVQNKGWKAPSDVLTGYQNLEKLVGVSPDQIIKLPKTDDASEWDQVFNKLGRPSKAEDYKLKMPEKGGNAEFVKWAQGAFHKAGLTAKQANAVIEQYNSTVTENFTKSAEAYENAVKAEESSLKKEWGMAYDQNLNQAKTAAKALELSDEHFEALEKTLGLAKTLKMFQMIGAKTGEAGFVSGNSKGSGHMKSPAAALSELDQLSRDSEWVRKFSQGDSVAVAEKARLIKMAYPELNN